jgi:hypothetical protein
MANNAGKASGFPEKPAVGDVASVTSREVEILLFAVAQPPVHGAKHIGVIVGPDPLILVGFGLRPHIRIVQFANIFILAR